MRIAYLVNQYPMTSQSFIRREIRALESQGFEVLRYAIRRWDGELVDDQDREERDRTHYLLDGGLSGLLAGLARSQVKTPFGLFSASRMTARRLPHSDKGLALHGAYLAEAALLRAWTEQHKVEHVHCHFATNSAEVAMLCRLMGGPPYSLMVHGPDELDRGIYLGYAEKIHHSAFTCAITSYCRSQLLRWTDHRDWEKVRILRCGLDEMFLSQSDVPPPQGEQLVCVGRLAEQKGQLLLLEAVKALNERRSDFRVLLLGDGPFRTILERKIAEWGISDRVDMPGWATNQEVRAAILSSRALLLPSFAEGLPVVIMEALALKRPVITTHIAGIPELVDPSVGWLVPPGSSERLVQAINACLDTPVSNLSSMGEIGRARVLERHDVQKEARRLADWIGASAASRAFG